MHKMPNKKSFVEFEEFILAKYGKTWRELKAYRRCKPTAKGLGLLALSLFCIVAYAIVFWAMHL